MGVDDLGDAGLHGDSRKDHEIKSQSGDRRRRLLPLHSSREHPAKPGTLLTQELLSNKQNLKDSSER